MRSKCIQKTKRRYRSWSALSTAQSWILSTHSRDMAAFSSFCTRIRRYSYWSIALIAWKVRNFTENTERLNFWNLRIKVETVAPSKPLRIIDGLIIHKWLGIKVSRILYQTAIKYLIHRMLLWATTHIKSTTALDALYSFTLTLRSNLLKVGAKSFFTRTTMSRHQTSKACTARRTLQTCSKRSRSQWSTCLANQSKKAIARTFTSTSRWATSIFSSLRTPGSTSTLISWSCHLRTISDDMNIVYKA